MSTLPIESQSLVLVLVLLAVLAVVLLARSALLHRRAGRRGGARLAGQNFSVAAGPEQMEERIDEAREARLWETLTWREREVASLVAQGKTNVQISLALLLSESTVRTHLRHIFKKLKIKSRVELVAVVMRAHKRERDE